MVTLKGKLIWLPEIDPEEFSSKIHEEHKVWSTPATVRRVLKELDKFVVEEWPEDEGLVRLMVSGCARRGSDHPIMFQVMDRPREVADFLWTHAGVCGRTGELVLMQMVTC